MFNFYLKIVVCGFVIFCLCLMTGCQTGDGFAQDIKWIATAIGNQTAKWADSESYMQMQMEEDYKSGRRKMAEKSEAFRQESAAALLRYQQERDAEIARGHNAATRGTTDSNN